MRKSEQEMIAQIVERTICQHEQQKEAAALAAKKVRHIRRRVVIVTSVAAVVVLTHHLTHIEPVGRIGEMTVGALFSWFFDKAAKAEA